MGDGRGVARVRAVPGLPACLEVVCRVVMGDAMRVRIFRLFRRVSDRARFLPPFRAHPTGNDMDTARFHGRHR